MNEINKLVKFNYVVLMTLWGYGISERTLYYVATRSPEVPAQLLVGLILALLTASQYPFKK